MILCDSHTHTSFSIDSEASPEEQITEAIRLGLRHIYITDHMDIGYPDGSFLLDVEDYYHKLLSLQDKYAGQIQVHTGIELGLRPQPDILAQNKELTDKYPFDYCIGSVHVVDNCDPYYPQYWESVEEETGIRRYYESMLQSILAFDAFDSLGHIDYIIRYCPSKGELLKKDAAFHRRIYSQIEAILEVLIQSDKALELNTGGWKYGLPYPHPEPEILKKYKQLGGTKITIGSDGHKPHHLAWDFHRVASYLADNGFDRYVRYEKHKAIFEKL